MRHDVTSVPTGSTTGHARCHANFAPGPASRGSVPVGAVRPGGGTGRPAGSAGPRAPVRPRPRPRSEATPRPRGVRRSCTTPDRIAEGWVYAVLVVVLAVMHGLGHAGPPVGEVVRYSRTPPSSRRRRIRAEDTRVEAAVPGMSSALSSCYTLNPFSGRGVHSVPGSHGSANAAAGRGPARGADRRVHGRVHLELPFRLRGRAPRSWRWR